MNRAVRAVAAFLFVVFTALVVGLAAPALAQAPANTSAEDAYKAHMTNGVKLYNSDDFKAALAEFEAAYRAIPKASPLINQALSYKELKNYPRAVERLELALAKHRDTMSEEDVAGAEKAIAEMRALFAYVTIAVTPEGAAVTVDGEQVAAAALSAPVPLSPGEHVIAASAEGFLPAFEKISVASSDRVEVKFALKPAKGTLRIIASSPDTLIEIDGAPATKGAWQGDLPAGSHMVRAVGETGAGTVEIVAGETLTIDLSKGPGPLPPLPTAPNAPGGPRRGFYGHVNGAVLVPLKHPYVFTDDAPSSGGYVGLRGGYRVHTYAAFEGLLEYGNVEGPANGAGDETYSLTSIRFGALLRLMSPGDLVHFVGTIGGGVAVHLMNYEDLTPFEGQGIRLCLDGRTECSSNGADFFAKTEVGVEIDFDNVLIGVALAAYVSGTKGMEDSEREIDPDNVKTTNVSKPYQNELLPQLGPRLYVGYAFW